MRVVSNFFPVDLEERSSRKPSVRYLKDDCKGSALSWFNLAMSVAYNLQKFQFFFDKSKLYSVIYYYLWLTAPRGATPVN